MADEDLLGAPSRAIWAPHMIRDILKVLTKPQNAIVTVVSKSLERPEVLADVGAHLDSQEPIYGTKYLVRDMSDPELELWRTATLDAALAMPLPNPYVPRDFSMIEEPSVDDSVPIHLRNESGSSIVWWRQCRLHKKPSAQIMPKAFTAEGYQTPLQRVYAKLASAHVADALQAENYYAYLAGFDYSFEVGITGVTLSVAGFSDKIRSYLEAVLHKVSDTSTWRKAYFKVARDNLRRGFDNFKEEEPYRHALQYHQYATTLKIWNVEELAAAEKDATWEGLLEFYSTLRDSIRGVESAVFGNVLPSEPSGRGALGYADLIEAKLAPKSRTSPSAYHRQVLVRPPAQGAVIQAQGLSADQANHAVLVAFHLGRAPQELNMQEHAMMHLLALVMEAPFFDTLRTKEQLGYRVHSLVHNYEGLRSLLFIIQGPKLDAAALDVRIEAFMEQMRRSLGSFPSLGVEHPQEIISDDNFEQKKQALQAELLQKDLSLRESALKAWKQISSREYWFTRSADLAAALDSVTLPDLRGFFEDRIVAKGSNRVSVEVFSQQHGVVAPRVRGLGSTCQGGVHPGGMCPTVLNATWIQTKEYRQSRTEFYP